MTNNALDDYLCNKTKSLLDIIRILRDDKLFVASFLMLDNFSPLIEGTLCIWGIFFISTFFP